MFFIRKIKHLLCAAVLFGVSFTQQVGAVEYKYSAKEVKCIQNMVYYEHCLLVGKGCVKLVFHEKGGKNET